MKRETREEKLKTLLKKLDISREVNALLLDIWREVDGAHADSDARQRAEIRRLRAVVKRIELCPMCELCQREAERALAPKRKRGGGR